MGGGKGGRGTKSYAVRASVVFRARVRVCVLYILSFFEGWKYLLFQEREGKGRE